MESGYISKEAKIEQKRRMDEQVGAVRDKMTKWSNKLVFGGYYKDGDKEYKEGDVWEDADGKEWTIKNGIKQTVTKLDSAKSPWWCPRCEGPMNNKLHDKFYRLRGACFDCVINYEGLMRVHGVWDAYERRTLRNNEKAFIKDRINENEEYIRTFRTPQIHFENGGWQELAPIETFQGRFAEMRADNEFLKERYKRIELDEAEDVAEQQKLLEWEKEHPWTTEKKNG
jgi:hypothetical protein